MENGEGLKNAESHLEAAEAELKDPKSPNDKGGA